VALVSLCLLGLLSGCGGAAAPAASSRAKTEPAAAPSGSAPSSHSASASSSSRAPGGSSGHVASLVMGVPGPASPEFAPFALAQKEGYYARYGLSLKLVRMKSSVEVAGLSAGQIQFSVNLSPLLVAAAKGLPIRLLMATNNVGFDLVSVPKITSAAQLRGGTVGETTPNGNFDLAARAMLTHLGVSPSSVKFVSFRDNSAIYAALRAGVIDAGVLGEPANILAERQGFHKLMNSASVYGGSLQGVATSVSMLQQHPDQVRGMLAGTLLALRFIEQKPTQSLAFMQPYLHQSASITKLIYDPLVSQIKDYAGPITESWVTQTLKVALPKATPPPLNEVVDSAPLAAAEKLVGGAGGAGTSS
jgi:ABC-type nitrate/sulfonate/bicarbonate transport system substrate-binding protein